MPDDVPILIERYVLDEIAYTLSIYKIEGGLKGTWFCGGCGRSSGPTMVSDSLPSALGRVKGNLYPHHTLHLLGDLPVMQG
jgi:hypothetical protein